MILPATSPAQAMATARRVYKSVSETPILPKPGAILTLETSIGVATWNGKESADAVLAPASDAAHRAKDVDRILRAAVPEAL